MREIRQIDRGGFGVVHEIETDDGRRLARKSFEPQVSSADERVKLAKRFAREIRIQSQIRHPNIMPVFEHDLDASPPWFTMPLAEKSFETKLQEDHANGLFDMQPWQDVLAAVEELHRLGYVHRDLKPANILLVDGTWVLSDFGLILPTARETTVLTGSKSAYGSHFYAAPEQARDFRNTPEQADIFALGCILHDAIDPSPVRIPFAQICISSPYGLLLEKCTELQPKKRFPTVAGLRAALFDIWRNSQFAPPAPDDATLLEAVTSHPDSLDAWRTLVSHIEGAPHAVRKSLLQSINSDLIGRLRALDDVVFSRLMEQMFAWASESSFNWDYCDVVGDRLLDAYRISPVRIRCGIVLAALDLATSHNRWHVMNQVGAMLSPAADNGLVDRILIEISMDCQIEARLRKIERIVHWSRAKWHTKIGEFLNARDAQQCTPKTS